MNKTGLKAFVCSFSFSLLAFVAAGREFFAVSPSDDELIIPSKNISLFFKDISPQALGNKTVKIKKIALNVPATPPPQNNKIEEKVQIANSVSTTAKSDLIPLTFGSSDIEFNVEEPVKELKIASKDVEAKSPSQEPAAKQKIVQNFDEIISHKPEIPNISSEHEDNEVNIENQSDEQNLEISPFSNKILQANVQILRPNAKNVQKVLHPDEKSSDVTVEDKESKQKESKQIIVAEKSPDTAQENISAETKTEETIVADATNETSLSEFDAQQEAPKSITSADNTTHDVELLIPEDAETTARIPTFKVARAKGNPENALLAKDIYGAGEPENLLIPIEKDTISAGNQTAKVVSHPETDKLAMLNKKASIKSMEKADASVKDSTSPEGGTIWQTMAEKSAKGKSLAQKSNFDKNYKSESTEKNSNTDTEEKIGKVLNSPRIKELQDDGKIQLASETVDNLLIPIPEDILNDPNLTPQLVSSEQNKGLEEKLTEEENKEYQAQDANKSNTISNTQSADKEDKSGILQSITSIFSKTAENIKTTVDKGSKTIFGKAKEITSSRPNVSTGKILPTEIRLAFQPNRAEISGVTLKWLQAFANKTIEDKNAGLEIRIDGSSSYELQQKRLNLLNNILASNGVDFSKINTVFTTREPNSFIIRAVRLNNANGGMEEDNDWQDYYKVW